MSKDEIIEGLKEGRTLIVQRGDDPLLPWLNELAVEGKVQMILREHDDQSSDLAVTWIEP